MNELEIVTKLNDDLYEMLSENNNPDLISFIEEYPFVILSTTGNASIIKFLGILDWNSENDERPYENEHDIDLCDIIPLDRWLKQEIQKMLIILNQVSTVFNNHYKKEIER